MSLHEQGSDAPRPETLSSAVDRGVRAVVIGSLLISLILVALLGWVSIVSQPQIKSSERALLALQSGHAAMLDQETGLRAFLVNGDLTYLQPYNSGRGDLARANTQLLAEATGPRLAQSIATVQLAQQQWVDEWAAPAASGTRSTPGDPAAQAAFLRAGKVLFDRYRTGQQQAVDLTSATVVGQRHRRDQLLVATLVAVIAVTALTAALSVRRRSALRREVLVPVTALLQGLASVSQGRLDHHVHASGPRELVEVIDGFNQMTAAMQVANTAADQREVLIGAQAERLQGILSMVREIGGSLNLKYVLISIVNAAASVSQVERVVVWLVTADGTALEPRWDSVSGSAVTEQTTDLGVGVVGRAAKYGRATYAGAAPADGAAPSIAVPLVVGARIIGVLQLVRADDQPLSDEQIEVVETLAIHAATAIEAARLHEGAEHASEHDALTRLANRRRLESDLDAECERSLRYARPLSFIMLDLDHFKTVNDTYGHARGDDVLQSVAALITDLLRSTDTAYRYGGEEIAVIVRESDTHSAQVLAERLRSRIESAFAGPGETGVTASLGIASMPTDAATPQGLVEAADAAMYTAKQQGRNRIVVAGAPATVAH